MRALKVSNPSMRAIADAMDRDQQYREVVRWSNSLQPARVTRWGGMISTPDEALQVRTGFFAVFGNTFVSSYKRMHGAEALFSNNKRNHVRLVHARNLFF